MVCVGQGRDGSDSTLISDDVVRKELQYCFSKFDIVKNNQAGWAYLEGLMDSRQYSNFPEIERYIRENVLPSVVMKKRRSHFAPRFINISGYSEQKRTDDAKVEYNILLDRLSKTDVIRCKYWEYRRREIDSGATA